MAKLCMAIGLISLLMLTGNVDSCEIQKSTVLPVDLVCRADFGRLAWQTDGNLVIYDGNNKAMWATNTTRRGHGAEFQADGNLVVYDYANRVLWASNTAGQGFRLSFQRDRNLVIYNSANKPVWATGTDI